jgi:hypothetical protein
MAQEIGFRVRCVYLITAFCSYFFSPALIATNCETNCSSACSGKGPFNSSYTDFLCLIRCQTEKQADCKWGINACTAYEVNANYRTIITAIRYANRENIIKDVDHCLSVVNSSGGTAKLANYVKPFLRNGRSFLIDAGIHFASCARREAEILERNVNENPHAADDLEEFKEGGYDVA